MKDDAMTIVMLVGSIITARLLELDFDTGLLLVTGCILVGMGLDVAILHIELGSTRWSNDPRMKESQAREIVEEFRNWPKPDKGEEPSLKIFDAEEDDQT